MYSNNSSTNAENDKTDSWSFSFDYQRFSNKNKPKSLLGRRRPQAIPQKNEEKISSDPSSTSERTPFKFQNVDDPPSLTHPVNPNVTPYKCGDNQFSQPSLDSRLAFTKPVVKNENSGQRGLTFSTPFKPSEQPLKDVSSSCDHIKLNDSKLKTNLSEGKHVVKDLSSVFINSVNKDLNTSFIIEDTYPFQCDNSLLNDDEKSRSAVKATDFSQTENANNSSFMTAHEIHPSDLGSFKANEFNFKTPKKKQTSLCSKTPGRNFTLFSISQSPIDPLTGILNEENESFSLEHSPDSSLTKKSYDSTVKNHVLDPNPFATCHNQMAVPSLEIDSINNDKDVIIKQEMKKSCEKTDVNSLASNKISSKVESEMETPKLLNSLVNDEHKPITVIHANNISMSKSNKNVIERSSNYEHNKEKCAVKSVVAEPPTVIVNNHQKHFGNEVYPVKSNVLQHVQHYPFVNSKLIVKPLPQNILCVNDKQYTALSLLGRGGSSEVYQVLEENSSKLMAIKCVNLASVDEGTANGYLNEIELLSKLQGCPSVIKMFDHEYVESTKTLYVVMEKGDIDLSKLLKDITKIKKIPLSMVIYYWTEMLTAVKDIHDKGVIHSDLKPGNFLLVSGRLKLIDFGIASSLQGDMTSVKKDVITGTFNYISPEAIHAGENRIHKINYKSDVWSLGCILYNLLFGCTPFSHITNTLGKFQAIADPNFKIKLPKESTHVPPALKLSLRWCLIKDAKLRPTVDRLLKLSEHAIRVPQIDKLWYQYVIKEFPDCCVSFEELGE